MDSMDYTFARDGITLEITAPRADIIRIRAGHPKLPENASWSVNQEVMSRRMPLSVTEAAGLVTLSTSAARVTVECDSLRVAIADGSGRRLLDDAPGRSLAFHESSFRARKIMPPDAHYFGLGDKTGPLDRRGGAFSLWNTDAFGFGESTDPLYKSIPFVLGADESGRAFGLFVDNTWRSFFDFGKGERDVLAFGAEGGSVDYYVMTGRDPRDVVMAYGWLTGTAPLAPMWALGFQQSRYSYETEAAARAVAERLGSDAIPSDVLYLDIDYQDRNRPFTVDTAAFPDLGGLIRDLEAQDFKLVLITGLHIAEAPNQGYPPYDSGMAADLFVKQADGGAYVGAVWPGRSVFPDFSRTAVREWWGSLYRDFVNLGVGGFWNDMNEPAIFDTREKTMPLDVVHRIEEPGFESRAASHAEMHNVYGLLNARATYEGLLKLSPDRRPFVLTRASYAGGQRHAATWTGDNSSSWNHLRLSTWMLANLGLSGFAYAGDDIGGFAGGRPSPDLLTRWTQVGAFTPIFRNHTGKPKAPQEVWVHGPEHEAIRRRAIEARYRLMPYLYRLAEENSRTGLPILRPVFLEFPEVLGAGPDLGGTLDQFMLGPDLLIAPPSIWESPSRYPITLPGEGWYDYWTGLRVQGSRLIESPRLERLPVFARPGAIVPHQPLVQSTAQQPVGNLELAVFPGPDGRGDVYLDDGISFAYRRGAFLRQTFSCAAKERGFDIGFAARQGQFTPWWSGIRVVLHGWSAPDAMAALDGRALAVHHDAQRQCVSVDLPDVATAATLTIRPA